MNKFYSLIVLAVFAVGIQGANAQRYTHEAGVTIGMAFWQGDFGERVDGSPTTENTGFSVSAMHYLNFPYRLDSYWNEHFKIRTELTYTSATLNNYGPIVEANSTAGAQLRAMTGKARTFEIGPSLEYHYNSISEFRSMDKRWSPYIALGIRYVYATPEISTTYGDGDINNLNNVFDTFKGRIDNDARSTLSFVFDAGIKYKVSEKSDIFLAPKWSYFSNNQVEGLSPDNPNNRANDWIFSINVGYIYSFDD
ncbi:MAG: glutamate dehydrogenase [Nonlabens sp.]